METNQTPTPETVAAVERVRALANLELAKIEAEKGLKQLAITARSSNLRIAQEILLENQRSKPFSERNVTAEDIIAFAETLDAYISENGMTAITTTPTISE